ncbi:MAG: radical SAM family heme chaperone HemW [Coriobacteriia bacterium]|nr:radical SAM family heme chaperone HemW [Coriobacteriia bacterium]
MGEQPHGVSLYLHVPFCVSKCAYCDFTSAADDPCARVPAETVHYVADALPSGADYGDAYVAALLAYLEEFVDAGVLHAVPSVYIGGGTPTLLGSRLAGLVTALRALPGLSADTEVTVEANPDSLTPALAAELASAGVTRVSLGVQSFDDQVLAWLGRRHDAAAAEAAASALRAAGLPFSVDLMCGVPGQVAASWAESVQRAIATGAGHVSVYPLSVEDDTPLAASIARGEVPEPDADTAADHLAVAATALRAAGFERYEVASYARPGQECRHNIRYWTGGAYLGVGPGAASMLPVHTAKKTPLSARVVYSWPDDWRVRFTWHDTTSGFLSCLWDCPPVAIEALDASDAVREDAMLGLRLSAGITDELATRAGAQTGLAELADAGLVEHVGGRWRTTERGWLLGNEVFGRVWSGE